MTKWKQEHFWTGLQFSGMEKGSEKWCGQKEIRSHWEKSKPAKMKNPTKEFLLHGAKEWNMKVRSKKYAAQVLHTAANIHIVYFATGAWILESAGNEEGVKPIMAFGPISAQKWPRMAKMSKQVPRFSEFSVYQQEGKLQQGHLLGVDRFVGFPIMQGGFFYRTVLVGKFSAPLEIDQNEKSTEKFPLHGAEKKSDILFEKNVYRGQYANCISTAAGAWILEIRVGWGSQ